MSAFLNMVPTRVLERRYQRFAKWERDLMSEGVESRIARCGSLGAAGDEYDRVADHAAAIYWVLRSRGLPVCPYCDTTTGVHVRSTCPYTLAAGLGLS
jgi:hypothetical protein